MAILRKTKSLICSISRFPWYKYSYMADLKLPTHISKCRTGKRRTFGSFEPVQADFSTPPGKGRGSRCACKAWAGGCPQGWPQSSRCSLPGPKQPRKRGQRGTPGRGQEPVCGGEQSCCGWVVTAGSSVLPEHRFRGWRGERWSRKGRPGLAQGGSRRLRGGAWPFLVGNEESNMICCLSLVSVKTGLLTRVWVKFFIWAVVPGRR